MNKYTNLKGVKVNKLTFISIVRKDKYPSKDVWLLKCDCGSTSNIRANKVVGGEIKSCGCIRREDICNIKFGNLLAVRYIGSTVTGRTIWLFKCDCGNLIEKQLQTVKINRNSHCGCKTIVRHNRLPNGEAELNQIIFTYKNNAKKRGQVFSLDREEFRALTQKPCYYCGKLPSQIKKVRNSFIYNGIDRLDSNEGYMLTNCVPCCGICNWMKSNLSIEQFLEHIKNIAIHQNIL